MQYVQYLLSLLCLTAFAIADLTDFNTWEHLRVDLGNVSIHARYAGQGPPLVLIHGYPEHSVRQSTCASERVIATKLRLLDQQILLAKHLRQICWSTVGPLLAAQNYTVITPDLRGMGDSGLPQDSDAYDAETVAGDVAGLLEFLNISTTLVFGHDKGSGVTAALVTKYRNQGFTFPRFGISEYPLPGFGYETYQNPTPTWNLYSNWQLAFFSIPDAAQFFIQGREREMLSWYFFHVSYSGTSVITDAALSLYTSSISKPGFLRSGLQLFSNPNIALDAAFFNSTLGKTPFQQPMLALGGEASFSPKSLLTEIFSPIAINLTADVVPKAGHWILDENPQWVASRLAEFFAPARDSVPSIDLSYLTNKVTLAAGPVFKR